MDIDIIKIVTFTLIAVILAVLVKSSRPEMAMMIELAAGSVILCIIAFKIMAVVSIIANFAKKIEFNNEYLAILFKIVGIAYIAEFGINFCKDANQSALSSKIELSAKILIILVSIPVLSGLAETLIKVMR